MSGSRRRLIVVLFIDPGIRTGEIALLCDPLVGQVLSSLIARLKLFFPTELFRQGQSLLLI